MVADVVGPVCETSDCFAKNYQLPTLKAGDLVAFLSAGAYGFVMASNYNSRGTAAEVLVKGNKAEVVRPRQAAEEIWQSEKLPGWM